MQLCLPITSSADQNMLPSCCCAFRFSKMQASATALLCEHEHFCAFARSISSRASHIFGPTSRHRVAQVLEAFRDDFTEILMTTKSRVTLVVLATLIARGMTTRCSTSPQFGLWRQADDIIRPHALLHDLLTQVTCRSEQHSMLPFGLVEQSAAPQERPWPL